jgi:4'-phosphopantetheinyl transferase
MSIYGSNFAFRTEPGFGPSPWESGILEAGPAWTRFHPIDESIEVLGARLDVDPATVRVLAELLSDAERRRAKLFAFERDRCRFIVARALLRRFLAAWLGIRPESVELVYGAHGKPALARCCSITDLRFNVSHSEDVAVYAFALGREVGIDVEAVREIRGADDLGARFFSRREYEAYLALDPRDRPLGFFNCWTRKEAFVKAIGDGLYHPLDRFDVSLTPGEPARILRIDEKHGGDCGWAIHSFAPESGFVGAVVVQVIGNEPSARVSPDDVELALLQAPVR